MIGPRRSEPQKILLGVSGASGLVMSLRLAEVLKSLGLYIVSVYTNSSLFIADSECISREWFLERLKQYSDEIYSEEAIDAPIASSSNPLDAYIIAPASLKTLALIANGIALNLLVRAVLNGIRMGRSVVAVFREAPLGRIELKVLYKVASLGVTIIPAVVGFYACPQNLNEVVDFIVGKVLDILGVDHNLYRRWRGARDPSIKDPCRIFYGSADS